MARVELYESLYEAFGWFLERCVLDDRSILWPDRYVWTLDNVRTLKERFFDAPNFEPGLSFEEKLIKQMEGANPELWRVLADIYYVYLLPSMSIKFETKMASILSAAEQAGAALPAADAPIWRPLRGGFAATGFRYHTKYAQFWLLVLYALRVKESPEKERLVRDPDRMQETLDGILEGMQNKNDRAYDMRHAMLYLAFPDRYERIISTSHKLSIVKAFGHLIPGQLPSDVDAALLELRKNARYWYKGKGTFTDWYQEDVKPLWQKREGETGEDEDTIIGIDEQIQAILSILRRTRNVILYGPPGTGKTFLAKRAAEAWVKPQADKPLRRDAAIAKAIQDLPFYQVIALGLYDAGPDGRYSVAEIAKLPAPQIRENLAQVKHPTNHIWGELQAHTTPESRTVKIAARRAPFLFHKDENSRWYLTDEGREFVAQNLSEQLAALRSAPSAKASATDFISWVTFHQSYSYEEFVEGLRPIASDDNQVGITYAVIPGVFRRICERAAVDPENRYVLIIDEINRGNIAKILGELITLLEDDKRSGQPNALEAILPYSGDTFSVPANLYLIGTMNTSDRSIALLDVALRRRFAFVEVMPEPELLKDAQVESGEGVVHLAPLLRGLNDRLRKHLDRDHQIGHSYFLAVAGAPKDDQLGMLEFAWNNQVLPLLEEYFYSQPERLAELLALEPGSEDEEIGSMRLTGDDLISALARLEDNG